MNIRTIIIPIIITLLIVSLSANAFFLLSPNKVNSSNSTTSITQIQSVTAVQPLPTTITLTDTTTKVILQYPTSAEAINQSAGVKLKVDLNSSMIVNYSPFQTALNITLYEYNIRSGVNNVSLGNNWPLSTLSFGLCKFSEPYGISVFKGYYTSDNVSDANSIYPPSELICTVASLPPKSYLFSSSNYSTPITMSVPLSGTCCRQIIVPNCTNCINQGFTPFMDGVYTLAAGDEWGDLVLLHFLVVSDPGASKGLISKDTHGIALENATGYSPCASCGTEYTFAVNAYNTGTTAWVVNPNDFTLVTNSSGIVYPVTTLYYEGTALSGVISANHTVSGELSFAVPSGQVPAALNYNDSADDIYTGTNHIPPISTWLSSISSDFPNVTFVNNANYLIGEGTILNSTSQMYQTGAKIVVDLNLIDLLLSKNTTIDSITVAGGFKILSGLPSFPIRFSSSPMDFVIVLSAPSSSYTGRLDFVVTTS